MTVPLGLKSRWGRAPLPALPTPQLNYLELTLTAEPMSAPRAPLNLCLLLDRSGSMQGAKIAALRAAVTRVIGCLAPQDILSIVAFDEQAELLLPAAVVTEPGPAAAAVAALVEQGGTALSQGLLLAEQQIMLHRSAARVSRLILLTDGQTWGDEDRCRAVAQRLAAAGVPMTAFGLGDEWNARLLEDLAAAGGGQADYIADAAEIDAFFQTAVRQVQTTAVQQAQLVFRLLPGVELRALHRVRPLVQTLPLQPTEQRTVTVELGDLALTELPQLLAEWVIAPRAVGEYRLATAQLHGRPLDGAAGVLAEIDLVQQLVADSGAVSVAADVMNLAERVSAFKLQTRALSELELGQVAGATRSLRAAATRLLDLGEHDHAARVAQQVEELEQQQQLSAAREKELRYRTRRLTGHLDG